MLTGVVGDICELNAKKWKFLIFGACGIYMFGSIS